MSDIKAITMQGRWIQLEPLNESHYDELYAASQDESIWTYTPSSGYESAFERWFKKALAQFKQGKQLPYLVRLLADNSVIGSSRYYDIDLADRRMTIGYTWYIPQYWGSYVNPECKFLLLQNAFENLDMNRVAFTIDARNARSRAAILKLGAQEEGILRHHMVLDDGTIRDTVVMSIIKPDWPELKVSFSERL